MTFVLLEINKDLRNQLILDSIIHNFADVDLIYFSIPTNLTISDQEHLIKQCFLFFQSQFFEKIQNHIFVDNNREVRININKSKELSWEIFFRFNKWVKVCDGIFDEDLDWFISGFTGKIIDFYSNDETSVFLIAFSGNALAKIPMDHLKTNFYNFSPFYTFLEPDLIMPDGGPENTITDEKQRIGIMLQLTDFQINLSMEDFDCFTDLLQFWKVKFKDNLINPMEVRIDSPDQSIYQLMDIPYFDERFGVWATLVAEQTIVDVPIMEIIKVINNESFSNLIIDYKKMMSNLLPN